MLKQIKRLARKNVSKMTCFVSGGTYNLDSINQCPSFPFVVSRKPEHPPPQSKTSLYHFNSIVVRLSGSEVVLINEVTLHRTRLVLGRVTTFGRANRPGRLSLAIPLWIGARETFLFSQFFPWLKSDAIFGHLSRSIVTLLHPIKHIFHLSVVQNVLKLSFELFPFHCCIFIGHRLMMLMGVEPENEKVYFNLGMLSMDDKDFEQAKAWFDRAIEVHIFEFATFINEVNLR